MTTVKTFFGILGGLISWMIGGLGLAFAVLLVLIALDFGTGLMVAAYSGNLSSAVGIKGFIKKMYIIILVGAVYMIERSVLHSTGVVGDGIVIAYSILEFLSIVENGGKLGVPIGPLRNIIAALKQKEGGNDGTGN
jgi:toxin secretion/phage lysis holin